MSLPEAVLRVVLWVAAIFITYSIIAGTKTAGRPHRTMQMTEEHSTQKNGAISQISELSVSIFSDYIFAWVLSLEMFSS